MTRGHFVENVCRYADLCRTASVRSLSCVALVMAAGIGCSTVAKDRGAITTDTSFSVPLTSYDLLQEIGGQVMDGSAAGEEVLTMASVDKFGFMETNPVYVSINGTKQKVTSLGRLPKANGQVRIVNGKLQTMTQQAQVDRDKSH